MEDKKTDLVNNSGLNNLQNSEGTVPVISKRARFFQLFKENWISILTDCLVFGSFGMGIAFLGPTVFDLGCQTRADLKEMNWVFFVQLLLTLVGSISAGCLSQRGVPLHVLILIGIMGLPITMFVIPACTSFAGLLLDLMAMGWCMGCIDCVANLRMIRRFEANVSPFLQALHFFYGLGAFISPMIAVQFILNEDCSIYIDGYDVTESGSFKANMTSTMSPRRSAHKISRAINHSHSSTAFLTLGGIQLAIALIVTTVIILEKRNVFPAGASISTSNSSRSLHSVSSDKDLNDLQDISGERLIDRCFTFGTREVILITFFTSFSLFIYDGIQSSYADFIYSYSEKRIKGLHRGEGAVLNACFWGFFAFGRLISIFVATVFTPAFMLLCNLTGTTTAFVCILIWRTDHAVMYICTCLLGLFLSSMSPTVMSMSEQYININPSITSCLVVCAALGETLCPVIVGNMFVALGPPSFLVFCLVITLVALVLYWLLRWVGRTTRKHQDTANGSFIFLGKVKDKKMEENILINSSNVKRYSETDNSYYPEKYELNNVENNGSQNENETERSH